MSKQESQEPLDDPCEEYERAEKMIRVNYTGMGHWLPVWGLISPVFLFSSTYSAFYLIALYVLTLSVVIRRSPKRNTLEYVNRWSLLVMIDDVFVYAVPCWILCLANNLVRTGS